MPDVTATLKRTSGSESSLANPDNLVSEVLVTCPAGTVVKVNGVQVNP